jgi:hypothetical protein
MTGHTASGGQTSITHAVDCATAVLEQATTVTAILTASLTAFQIIHQLARSCEDRKPHLFAAFFTATGAAIEGREAIMLAASPPPVSHPAEITAPPDTDAEDIADSLAALAAVLAGRLVDAGTMATAPGDQAACLKAAAAAREVHRLLTGPGHEPGPR